MIYKEKLKIKQFLRNRICTDKGFKHLGNENAFNQLSDLVSRSLHHNESNSSIIIGPRGSGKSELIENVLSNFKVDRREDSLKIYLNGFVQVDENLGLREILKQMDVSLQDITLFSSVHENLQYVLDLMTKNRKIKHLIIILDELELFLKQKNQSLIYNLFDLTQSHRTPTCIIGISTRMDILELFEKRVKSRFSQRLIPTFFTMTFQIFKDIAFNVLSLPYDLQLEGCVVDQWNKNVKDLLTEPVVEEILKMQFNFDNNINLLHSLLLYPVASLSLEEKEDFRLKAEKFVASYKLMHATDSTVSLMEGLSVLELCLVVASARLEDQFPCQPFNFEMLYQEYMSFVGRKFTNMNQEKMVVMKAFENLISLELLTPHDNNPKNKSQRNFRLMTSSVDLPQVREVANRLPHCPTNIRQWIKESA